MNFKKLMEKYPSAILGLCEYSKSKKNGGIMECSYIAPCTESDFDYQHAGYTDIVWNDEVKGFEVLDENGRLLNSYCLPYNIYIPYKLNMDELKGDIKDFLDTNPDIELTYLPVVGDKLSREFLEVRRIKETGELRVDNNYYSGSFSPVLQYTLSTVLCDYEQGLISTQIEQTRVKFQIPISVKYNKHKNEPYLYVQSHDVDIITGYFYKKITTFD